MKKKNKKGLSFDKRVNFWISSDLYDEFKKVCIQKKTRIAEQLRRFVSEFIEREKRKK